MRRYNPSRIKQKHSYNMSDTHALSAQSDAGAKDSIAVQHWGWSKDYFDPLGDSNEVVFRQAFAGNSPQQQDHLSKQRNPSPSAPVDLPKPSKHSPIPSLSSFSRLASVPRIPTLPSAQELSSVGHGILRHVESKEHVVKNKPQKTKSAANFANLSLSSKLPSKRRVSNGPQSPPK